VELWPRVWCLVFFDSRCSYISSFLKRHDTISYFYVRSKTNKSQINLCCMEPKTKKWKSEKLKRKKPDVLRSVGKQPGESVESVPKKKRKAIDVAARHWIHSTYPVSAGCSERLRTVRTVSSRSPRATWS